MLEMVYFKPQHHLQSVSKAILLATECSGRNSSHLPNIQKPERKGYGFAGCSVFYPAIVVLAARAPHRNSRGPVGKTGVDEPDHRNQLTKRRREKSSTRSPMFTRSPSYPLYTYQTPRQKTHSMWHELQSSSCFFGSCRVRRGCHPCSISKQQSPNQKKGHKVMRVEANSPALRASADPAPSPPRQSALLAPQDPALCVLKSQRARILTTPHTCEVSEHKAV